MVWLPVATELGSVIASRVSEVAFIQEP